MTEEEILTGLRRLMQRTAPDQAQWETVSTDTEIGTLGFDSLSILDLVYDIQVEFGLDFDPEEIVEVRTVGELAAFLLRSSSPPRP